VKDISGSGGRHRRAGSTRPGLPHWAGSVILLVASCGGHGSAPAPPSAFRPALHSVALDRALARPGGAVDLTLRFTNLGGAPADRDLRVFVHVESAADGCCAIACQDDHAPATPTTWWRPGEVVDLGVRELPLPEDIPEGLYALHVGLYDLATESVVVEGERSWLAISEHAPAAGSAPSAPLSAAELARRDAAEAARFAPSASLDGAGWRYEVDAERAVFRLLDLEGGASWSSHPLHERLGIAHLRRGEELVHAPLDEVLVAASEDVGLTLEAAGRLASGARVRVELRAEAVDDGRGLRLGWRALGVDPPPEPPAGDAPAATLDEDVPAPHEGWTVEAVTLLDHAPWTTDADRGAVLTPQWLGELGWAEGARPDGWMYRANDISMQMAGVLRRECALLVTWTDHGAQLFSHVERFDDERLPGRSVRSVSLKLTPESPTLELYPLGVGDYVDIATAYRRVAERRGHRRSWAQKRAEEPRVDRLVGAPILRVVGMLGAPGDAPGEVLHTFDQVAACAEHWKRDLELDRVQLLLGGWNCGGYDDGHPDVLPASAVCGGDAGLANCAQRVRELGYLFALHDNYQDVYEDSPSYDPDLVGLEEDGSPRAGGEWAGGQSWMVCTTQQLGFAQRNLPEVRARFEPDAYFLDTTLTTRLQGCSHPAHPMEPLEDRELRRELFDYARKTFGLLGLEGAREWAVPAAHSFEGILTHRTLAGERFTPVPVFPLVYGDCLNLFTLHGDGLEPSSAKAVLDLLLLGELPMYLGRPGRYWESPAALVPLTEEQQREPEFTFARADQGWAQHLGPVDRFLKNSYEVLSYTHRAIGDAPMTDHRFLRGDRTAEWSAFGDVEVTVNVSDAPLRIGHTVLGRNGFLVTSPGFVAFHALAFGGVEYPGGACFTLRSLDGLPLGESKRVRVFHAFGDPRVRLPDAIREVARETVVAR